MPNRRLSQQHLKSHLDKLELFNKVRIYSEEHHSWWKPNELGYTTDILQAGIYDVDDAWYATKHFPAEKKVSFEEVFEYVVSGLETLNAGIRVIYQGDYWISTTLKTNNSKVYINLTSGKSKLAPELLGANRI